MSSGKNVQDSMSFFWCRFLWDHIVARKVEVYEISEQTFSCTLLYGRNKLCQKFANFQLRQLSRDMKRRFRVSLAPNVSTGVFVAGLQPINVKHLLHPHTPHPLPRYTRARSTRQMIGRVTYFSNELELPAMAQLCRIHMVRDSCVSNFAEVHVRLPGATPKAAPLACFPCFGVSLWPVFAV